jgi:hypothetical protein
VGLGKEVTVLLVLSPDCIPCRNSMGFYRRLIALPQMDGRLGRIVVLAQGGVVPMNRVLDESGFKPHGVTSGPAATHEIRDLPFVVVLDRAGRRQGSWSGVLTLAQEEEVVARVKRSSSAPWPSRE